MRGWRRLGSLLPLRDLVHSHRLKHHPYDNNTLTFISSPNIPSVPSSATASLPSLLPHRYLMIGPHLPFPFSLCHLSNYTIHTTEQARNLAVGLASSFPPHATPLQVLTFQTAAKFCRLAKIHCYHLSQSLSSLAQTRSPKM